MAKISRDKRNRRRLRRVRPAPGGIVLLDRDGVINADRPGYVLNWKQFRFLPGSKAALKRLKEHGYRVHVVSNQSAVGRGLMSREQLDAITSRMLAAIRRAGGEVESIHYCTHRPEDNCDCRKPRIGLLKEVAKKFDVDLEKAWFVGDKMTDMEAGHALGCRIIFVKTGLMPEAELSGIRAPRQGEADSMSPQSNFENRAKERAGRIRPGKEAAPDLIAENLLDAVRHIIGEERSRTCRRRPPGNSAPPKAGKRPYRKTEKRSSKPAEKDQRLPA